MSKRNHQESSVLSALQTSRQAGVKAHPRSPSPPTSVTGKRPREALAPTGRHAYVRLPPDEPHAKRFKKRDSSAFDLLSYLLQHKGSYTSSTSVPAVPNHSQFSSEHNAPYVETKSFNPEPAGQADENMRSNLVHRCPSDQKGPEILPAEGMEELDGSDRFKGHSGYHEGLGGGMRPEKRWFTSGSAQESAYGALSSGDIAAGERSASCGEIPILQETPDKDKEGGSTPGEAPEESTFTESLNPREDTASINQNFNDAMDHDWTGHYGDSVAGEQNSTTPIPPEEVHNSSITPTPQEVDEEMDSDRSSIDGDYGGHMAEELDEEMGHDQGPMGTDTNSWKQSPVLSNFDSAESEEEDGFYTHNFEAGFEGYNYEADSEMGLHDDGSDEDGEDEENGEGDEDDEDGEGDEVDDIQGMEDDGDDEDGEYNNMEDVEIMDDSEGDEGDEYDHMHGMGDGEGDEDDESMVDGGDGKDDDKDDMEDVEDEGDDYDYIHSMGDGEGDEDDGIQGMEDGGDDEGDEDDDINDMEDVEIMEEGEDDEGNEDDDVHSMEDGDDEGDKKNGVYEMEDDPYGSAPPFSTSPGTRVEDIEEEGSSGFFRENSHIYSEYITTSDREAQDAEMRSVSQEEDDITARPENQGSSLPSQKNYSRNFDIRHDNILRLQLKREVRHLAAELLNLPFSPLRVPTPAQLNTFHRSLKERDGPSLDDLRLDLDSEGVASQWNKRAGLLFAKRFVASPQYSSTDLSAVAKAFAVHLVTLRQQYRANAKSFDCETAPEVALEQALDKSLKSRRNRRRALRHRRKEACESYKEDPSMKRFLPLWKSLPLEAMSGDESSSDITPRAYAITVLPWRNPSPEITKWMRTFDHLHLSTRFGSDDRPTPGNFPHRRVPSKRIETHSVAPSGLPRNFYDPLWLQTLDKFETDALEIRSPIDLTFSLDIKFISARFAAVKTRKTPPLPRNDSTLPPRSTASQNNPPSTNQSRKRRAQGRR